jgi:hypothetical protein
LTDGISPKKLIPSELLSNNGAIALPAYFAIAKYAVKLITVLSKNAKRGLPL